MSEEANELLQELEEANGGKVLYKTYAILYCTSDEAAELKQLAGLLYTVGDTLYFEDFEKQDTLFGFIMPKKKKAKYEKFKIRLPLSEISDIYPVRSAGGKAVAEGKLDVSALKPATSFFSRFSQTALYIGKKQGGYWILEVLDERETSRELIKMKEEL